MTRSNRRALTIGQDGARDRGARLAALIVLALLMVFWELVCRRAGSTLPPPSRVYKDNQGTDLRSVLRIMAGSTRAVLAPFRSLRRVALGYSLAAIAGVALGTAGRAIGVGDRGL